MKTTLSLSIAAVAIIVAVIGFTAFRDGVANPDFASYGQPAGLSQRP